MFLAQVLLNPDTSCFSKQCRSRSVSFWRSQLIWIYTVCHSVFEFVSTTWIKQSDWLKIKSGHGIWIYSAWQGLIFAFWDPYLKLNSPTCLIEHHWDSHLKFCFYKTPDKALFATKKYWYFYFSKKTHICKTLLMRTHNITDVLV